MKRQYMEGVTFVGRWPLQFSTAAPYIEELLSREVPVHFVVSQPVARLFHQILRRGRSIISLEELEGRHRAARLAHAAISRISAVVNRGEARNRKRNAACKLGVSAVLRNPLPTRKVVHVTKSNVPWLLCARDVQVYTVAGSWDHPAKFGATGYQSHLVFTWNGDLADDWRACQGDEHFGISYPFVFDYLLDPEVLCTRAGRPLGHHVLYPFTSSSASDPQLFREEMLFASALIGACSRIGLPVFVKPKPNGVPGELDPLGRAGEVSIGAYFENNRKENILLTAEYNAARIAELSKARISVNIATTFAFDAALFGLPVAQMEIRAPEALPMLTRLQAHLHTQRHVLGVRRSNHVIDDDSPLTDQLHRITADWDRVEVSAREHSQRLYEWILPGQGMAENIRSVADAILN
ncbi:MAG: hypothetical protein IT532_03565 [Burkholderiales bacterium]|nr:hypothetical protein [Burkholderiales bacterium]